MNQELAREEIKHLIKLLETTKDEIIKQEFRIQIMKLTQLLQPKIIV